MKTMSDTPALSPEHNLLPVHPVGPVAKRPPHIPKNRQRQHAEIVTEHARATRNLLSLAPAELAELSALDRVKLTRPGGGE